MNCGIVYFSATGNTEYVAKLFKKELDNYGIKGTLLESTKEKRFEDCYDMYVIGSPVHCEVFPEYFENYVLKNLRVGRGRKVIIFATQVANNSPGPYNISQKLKARGFKVYGEAIIRMPNNFFVVGFGKTSEPQRQEFIKEAREKVSMLTKEITANNRQLYNISKVRVALANGTYSIFKYYFHKWAKRRLAVDSTLCIRCGICERGCPTNNIEMKNTIIFKDKCISCQKCMHICPKNAFTYKGKHFEQYIKI
jgi:ferredoxin